MMTVWLVGHPYLNTILNRAPYASLASRIQCRIQIEPIVNAGAIAHLFAAPLHSQKTGH